MTESPDKSTTLYSLTRFDPSDWFCAMAKQLTCWESAVNWQSNSVDHFRSFAKEENDWIHNVFDLWKSIFNYELLGVMTTSFKPFGTCKFPQRNSAQHWACFNRVIPTSRVKHVRLGDGRIDGICPDLEWRRSRTWMLLVLLVTFWLPKLKKGRQKVMQLFFCPPKGCQKDTNRSPMQKGRQKVMGLAFSFTTCGWCSVLRTSF